MLDLVIRGGRVVTPSGVVDWDVGVQGERIAALGAPGTLDAGPPGRPAGEQLLAGSGSFAQMSLRGQVVEQRGDVPAGAPVVPAKDGLSTVQIAGVPFGHSDYESGQTN